MGLYSHNSYRTWKIKESRRVNPNEALKRIDEYVERNKSLYLCSVKFRLALKAGFIQKKTTCDACGSEKNVQAHHPDYSKPFDVDWLCSRCHSNNHGLLRSERRSREIQESETRLLKLDDLINRKKHANRAEGCN